MVEEELKKGWKAASQLRSLLSQPDQLITEEEKETKMASMKNYSTDIINSFNTCISTIKKIVQSVEKGAKSVEQTVIPQEIRCV